MHSYNPFLLPDTIAIIVQKLPLVSLSIALCINHIWNKEVKLELHMRREKFKNQYWRTVSVRYMEIQLKEQCWEEEGRRFSDCMDTDDYKKYNDKMRFLDGKCNESFYKLVEVEGCMLRNKLIRKRERGDVLNRINHVNKSGWLHPWSEYEIEEMINPIDYELNILFNETELIMEEVSQGIYIPARGPPEIKQVNVKKGDIFKILQSDYSDHVTIFRPKGFDLILFCDDDGQSKGLSVNPLATRLISQRIGQDGVTIPGPALLLDNYRKITLDDLHFLLKEPFDIEEEKKAVKKMNDVLKDLKLCLITTNHITASIKKARIAYINIGENKLLAMIELSIIPISDEPLINTSSEDANMEDISNQFHKLYFDIDVVKLKKNF
ncbi:13210_t:CDS:2 [Entrophospora sp. SA101]|nr:13210_t:CDS:2 [Entrophospora sp. SA101]